MFLKVHIGINDKVLSFSIENIPEYLKRFRLGDQLIETLDGVTEISITDELFIITTEDPGFRNSKRKSLRCNECSVDVIKAYSWEGQFLWSIKDIIQDLNGIFLGGFLIERAKIDLPNGYYLPNGACVEDILSNIDQSHPLYACFDGGWRYILDLKDKRVLFRSPNR